MAPEPPAATVATAPTVPVTPASTGRSLPRAGIKVPHAGRRDRQQMPVPSVQTPSAGAAPSGTRAVSQPGRQRPSAAGARAEASSRPTPPPPGGDRTDRPTAAAQPRSAHRGRDPQGQRDRGARAAIPVTVPQPPPQRRRATNVEVPQPPAKDAATGDRPSAKPSERLGQAQPGRRRRPPHPTLQALDEQLAQAQRDREADAASPDPFRRQRHLDHPLAPPVHSQTSSPGRPQPPGRDRQDAPAARTMGERDRGARGVTTGAREHGAQRQGRQPLTRSPRGQARREPAPLIALHDDVVPLSPPLKRKLADRPAGKDEDPLRDSYERLKRAARRQQELQAQVAAQRQEADPLPAQALDPDPELPAQGDDLTRDQVVHQALGTDSPDSSGTVTSPAQGMAMDRPVTQAEPAQDLDGDDALRDGDRNDAATDTNAEHPDPGHTPVGYPDAGQTGHDQAAPEGTDHDLAGLAQAAPDGTDHGQPTGEEVTVDDLWRRVQAATPAIEVEQVLDPDAIPVIDPETVSVIEDAIIVDEQTVDQAMDQAVPRTPYVEPPTIPQETLDEPSRNGRGFSVLSGVLILVIFLLMGFGYWRLTRGVQPAKPAATPTPIVPTQSVTPTASPSAKPSQRPAASPTATPVPALPPRQPLPSDAALPPALPGQAKVDAEPLAAGRIEIGKRTITVAHINDTNLPGLVGQHVAGDQVQIQSVLSQGAHVWLGTDQENRILAILDEDQQAQVADLAAGDRINFIGELVDASEPEILAPEQGRDRLIRQGAAIAITEVSLTP